MRIIIPNKENVYLIHLINNPHLYEHVDSKFFEDEFVGKLYNICKQYNKSYGGKLFDENDRNVDQLIDYCKTRMSDIILDNNKSEKANLELFIDMSTALMSTPYNRYGETYVDQSIRQWAEWRSFYLSMQNALSLIKLSDINEGNYKGIINQVSNMISVGSSLHLDDDDGLDLMDPESHLPDEDTEHMPCGWKTLDEWLGGGFEIGTLSMFYGETNIGKSIWLIGLAVALAKNGYNVIVVSVEMKAKKVVRRAAVNLFDVDADIYDTQDKMGYEQLIYNAKNKYTTQGKVIIKSFVSATPSTISGFALRMEKKYGIKIHALVIDYLTELDNEMGYGLDQSYMYHKTNTKKLYQDSKQYKWAAITAHQIKQIWFGAHDYPLNAGIESSGIMHSTDNIFGLIQTEDMKESLEYWLKNLKGRETKFKNQYTRFDINYDKMQLTNDPKSWKKYDYEDFVGTGSLPQKY